MINDQEKLFAKFLQINSIVWDVQNKKQYEKFGDFYFPDENIMLELKSLQETEISKILIGLPKNQVMAIPFRDSFSAINNHLSDANVKATRAKNNKKYSEAIFVALLDIVDGYDLKIHELFGILQSAKLLNYPLHAKNGTFLDEENNKYYIREKVDDNDLLQNIDYIGILRRYGEMNNWKIELIEKPNYKNGKINTKASLGRYIKIWQPKFI